MFYSCSNYVVFVLCSFLCLRLKQGFCYAKGVRTRALVRVVYTHVRMRRGWALCNSYGVCICARLLGYLCIAAQWVLYCNTWPKVSSPMCIQMQCFQCVSLMFLPCFNMMHWLRPRQYALTPCFL